MSGFCEVITYSFHCTQTGSCASGTCDQCSLCVDETVNYVYCGSQLVGGSHPIESLTGGGSPSGGIGEYDGIYIPNPYDGEADLNNEEFLLAVQVANFTKTLPANLKNLMANNFWFYPNILDFIKNNGGLTQVNKDAVVFTLNNIEAIFTTISQNPNNLTSTQINEIKYNAFIFLLQHGAWLAGQSATTQQSIFNYLIANGFSDESKEFVEEVRNYLIQNPNLTFEYVMDNKTSFNDQGEIDNYTIGNYDNTTYSSFNPQQTWTNISSVIPLNKFVGWNSRAHPKWQCMEYAKEQIRVMGYQISSYYSVGQTFQIYTSGNGVNTTQLSQGLSYLKSALSRGIPVIVGVDDAPGHPGNLDNTTDHFIVIVGMGSNANGKYFQFYDNASASSSQGASALNLLYYNSTTGIISGSSQTLYGQGQPYPYILTMIRKSKLL